MLLPREKQAVLSTLISTLILTPTTIALISMAIGIFGILGIIGSSFFLYKKDVLEHTMSKRYFPKSYIFISTDCETSTEGTTNATTTIPTEKRTVVLEPVL